MSRIFRSMGVSEDAVLIPDLDTGPAFDPEGAPEARGVMTDEVTESILRRAREQADDMVQKALARAHEERAALLEQARQEGEQLREQARQEGFQQGVIEKTEEIANCIGDVLTCLDELREEHQRYEEAYEHELQHFAVDVAEKVLLDTIDHDGLCLKNLVKQAVRGIRDADWIGIEVSEALPDLVAYLENELGRLGREPGEPRIEVSGEPLDPGACIVQTAEGLIDASVTTQLRNIRELFKNIDWQEEQST